MRRGGGGEGYRLSDRFKAHYCAKRCRGRHSVELASLLSPSSSSLIWSCYNVSHPWVYLFLCWFCIWGLCEFLDAAIRNRFGQSSLILSSHVFCCFSVKNSPIHERDGEESLFRGSPQKRKTNTPADALNHRRKRGIEEMSRDAAGELFALFSHVYRRRKSRDAGTPLSVVRDNEKTFQSSPFGSNFGLGLLFITTTRKPNDKSDKLSTPSWVYPVSNENTIYRSPSLSSPE